MAKRASKTVDRAALFFFLAQRIYLDGLLACGGYSRRGREATLESRKRGDMKPGESGEKTGSAGTEQVNPFFSSSDRSVDLSEGGGGYV